MVNARGHTGHHPDILNEVGSHRYFDTAVRQFASATYSDVKDKKKRELDQAQRNYDEVIEKLLDARQEFDKQT